MIPAGLELTEPAPFPDLETLRLNVWSVKVAVTDVAAVIDTTQVPVPEHPLPDQPVKVEPVEGVAVRVTEVPKSNVIEHVTPQSMPDGLEDTDPVPVPFFATSSCCCGWLLKFAVTDVAAVIETTQVPVPEQPEPDQPVKVEPVDGVAVKVTLVP